MKANRLLIVALAMAGAIQSTPLQAAFLNGQTFFARLEHENTFDSGEFAQNSGLFVVGPGVELVNFGSGVSFPATPVIMDIDISDSQILITAVTDQPLAFKEQLLFQIIGSGAPRLTGVFLNPSTNWAGFSQSHIGSVSQQFRVNLTSLTASQGQYILLDLVPEPAAAALLWPALGLVAARRRRRRASSRKVSPAPVGDPS